MSIIKFPTKMNIAGQAINVDIIDTPLYQMHVCPHCIDPHTGQPYRYPAKYGTHEACPCCGAEDTQPVQNCYVLGQFNVLDNTITNWYADCVKDVCGTSFVHETIEAINSVTDLKLNHTQITTLASTLYQAFSSGEVEFGAVA